MSTFKNKNSPITIQAKKLRTMRLSQNLLVLIRKKHVSATAAGLQERNEEKNRLRNKYVLYAGEANFFLIL